MGNSSSKTENHKHHESKYTSMPIRMPLPEDPNELERRFTKVLVSWAK